jgi:5-dehydro-4-deoxyglucarate dehydratase
VTMEGVPAGPVRPPLVMPAAADLNELATIVAAGREVLADALTGASGAV